MSIKKIYISIFFVLVSTNILFGRSASENRYTIMLDPAGDARQTGRIIGTSFERAVTFQIAQSLQNTLQNSLPCTVIITRSSGEAVHHLQSANFANRLPIDLYISLHCYHAPQEKHTVAVYVLSHGNTLIAKQPDLAMIPCTNAHLSAINTTKKYAHSMHHSLQLGYAHQFQLPPVVAIPFAPLVGIQAPAIGIEINCLSPDNVALYVEPIAKAIISTLTP